jgi:hypothetical protein
MAGKRFLTQMEVLINSTLSAPESGYLGFGAKSEGFYMKTPTAEHLILTTQEMLTEVREAGTATDDKIVSEAGIRRAINSMAGTLQPQIILEEGHLLGRRDGAGAGPPDHVRLGYGLGWNQYGQLEVTATGGGGSGTVTSVGLSMPNIFSVGPPVTTSGDLTAALVSQTKSHVFAAPYTANGVPTFRALVAADLPDLSGTFDFYGSWNMQVNSGTTKLITKTGSQQSANMYNGIKLIAGANVTLSESNANGALGITISAAAGGGGGLNFTQMTLNQSPSPITANVWTDVPAMSVSTWGDGAYLVIAHVSMVKGTTGAGSVAMQIVTDGNTAIATGEQYMLSSSANRATISLSSVFMVEKGDPASVRMRIHSNTSGWSAVASTLNSQSPNATQITLIKIA